MKILFLARFDWANVANRVARAINSVGGHAHVLTAAPHPFGYEEDWIIEKQNHTEVFDWCRDIDWLISCGDGDYGLFGFMMKLLPLPAGVKLATMHAGSAYRNSYENYNQQDEEIGFLVRFVCADLYRFCSDDPYAVPYLAPPNSFYDFRPAAERLRVAHSPSNRGTKGTEAIMEVLGRQQGIEIDLIEKVPYNIAADRRAQADIFVDQLEPRVGTLGAAGTEAMAAGCAVLADVRYLGKKLARFWPLPPVIHVEDKTALEVQLQRLICDPAALAAERKKAYAWAKEVMAPEPLARFWLKHLARASTAEVVYGGMRERESVVKSDLAARPPTKKQPSVGHALAVLTAPRKVSLLERTLASLEAAGLERWLGRKFLVDDGSGAVVPQGWTGLASEKSEGGVSKILLLFCTLLEDTSFETLTFFEDDIVLAKNALDYIAQTSVDDDLALLSWHCQYELTGRPQLVLLPTDLFTRVQGVTFSRETIETIVMSGINENTPAVGRSNDQFLKTALPGKVYGVHFPNLVQHTGGDVSALGNVGERLSPSFVGEEFDALKLST